MNLFQLSAIISTLDTLLPWLREKGLISDSQICKECSDCASSEEENVRAKRVRIADSSLTDGKVMRCRKCQGRRSIRTGTFFSCTKLSLKTVVLMMYLWSNKIRNNQTLKMLGGEVKRTQTVGYWYNQFRNVCSQYLLSHPVVLGGNGDIVEIDETKVGAKRKANRGRASPGLSVWMLTMIERRRKLPYFIIVPDRSKATLQPLIKRVVAEGTIIYSDEWASYADLDKIRYHHETVNHSVEFVSSEGVHINTIEILHNEVKLELKICRGVLERHLPAFLDEFVFRKVMRDRDMFESFIDAVKDIYPQ